MKKSCACLGLKAKPTVRKRLEWYKIPTKTAVHMAAKLLDMSVPFNWAQKVNLRTLNMACPKHCILGQIFGNYYTAFSLAYSEQRRRVAFLSNSRAVMKAWQNEINQRLTTAKT